MNSQRLAQYKQRLEKLADQIGRTAASLEEEVRVPVGGDASGGLSNAPIHLGDLGTQAFSQELDTALLENETYLHGEAFAALDRIRDGTFGCCVSCGKSIGAARLDALPYVRQCVGCAQRSESGLAVNVNEGRPTAWLGEPGHEAETATPQRTAGRELGADRGDTHAAGTPGGGTAVGGLAGTNIDSGTPAIADLRDAMAGEGMGGEVDEEELPAEGGRTGGAVGGTPANKRVGGTARKGKAAKPKTRAKKSHG